MADKDMEKDNLKIKLFFVGLLMSDIKPLLFYKLT